MTALMTVIGIVVFFFGLLISIAWHELGHLSTAKLFKIRVPQYMVGFGPTLWSRHKGETEYGVKWIPLGGYIRMIGMFPPGNDGRVTARSTSPFRSMIEDARAASYEEVKPGDEDRLFYTRKPWKRVIVMFAGPFMNLILAFVLFLLVLMGFGQATQTTTVSQVSDCVISQSDEAALKAKNPCASNKYAESLLPRRPACWRATGSCPSTAPRSTSPSGPCSRSRSARPPARPRSPCCARARPSPCTPT